ncbi:hypothetical protein V5T82_07195 [Magnetovibrio sp. PR-2]|uniref:hypothetical protein n=1 Tax=Magnetovibrio sp. PR-2 TaxID=3120356 RepID=UPI002FCE53D5
MNQIDPAFIRDQQEQAVALRKQAVADTFRPFVELVNDRLNPHPFFVKVELFIKTDETFYVNPGERTRVLNELDTDLEQIAAKLDDELYAAVTQVRLAYMRPISYRKTRDDEPAFALRVVLEFAVVSADAIDEVRAALTPDDPVEIDPSKTTEVNM